MLSTTIVADRATLGDLRPEWDELLARSATNEPTLSPAWMLAWWDVFGPRQGRALRALAFRAGGRLVGLAPLLARRRAYVPGLALRRLELLASGEDEADEVCSDYIGVIAERGAEREVAEAFALALQADAAGPWDELVLPALDGASPLPAEIAAALRRRGVRVELEETARARYIPLPARWDDYLAALAPEHRYLLRRSLREFEKWAGDGATLERVARPHELPRARSILHALHGERWAGTREAPGGAFGSPRFCAFHDAVMPALLERGALELAWLSVRGDPVAALYNLRWNGKVYFYQSGRRVDLPRGVRVGIVMHAHAIRAAIERGDREYDFLAGSSRYKSQLAPATRPLLRLRAARPSWRESARGAVEQARAGARALRELARELRRARGQNESSAAGAAADGEGGASA